MYRVVFPNRWFVWATVATVFTAALLLWQIELFSIEQDVEVMENATSTLPISQESIDTLSWKTYRNEKYGFEVKYPSKYEISTEPSYPDLYEIEIDFINSTIPRRDDLVLRVEENKAKLDLKSWYRTKPLHHLEECNSRACTEWTYIGVGLYEGLLIDYADVDHGQSFDIFLDDKVHQNIISLVSVGLETNSLGEMKKILETIRFFEPKT